MACLTAAAIAKIDVEILGAGTKDAEFDPEISRSRAEHIFMYSGLTPGCIWEPKHRKNQRVPVYNAAAIGSHK